MSNIFLSVIIPAHNEAHRLPDTLAQVTRFLDGQAYTWEVLVVENGSTDETLALAQSIAATDNRIRVLQMSGPGKGRAVQAGMLAAHGQYRFMADADLSMPVSELPRFLPPNLPDADVIIGSREAKGAVRYNEPGYRHWGGRAINTAIRLLILPDLHDTQCGFKCFRAPVAEQLFRLQRITGWAFDIEILFLARRMGFSIAELPIPWYFNPESKLHVIKDALRLLWDILIIRYNSITGTYDPPASSSTTPRS